MCDLVRVGKQSGKGYVLPYRLVSNTRILLSFDINNARAFEADFLRTKKDIILYAFDYSVSAKMIGFRRKEKRHFIKKLFGSQTNDKYVSIPEIFNRYLLTALDLSVFVKMDIENSEFRTLLQFRPYWNKINGFVVEFHELDLLGNKFDHIIRELSAEFYVAHVHANNNTGYIYQTTLPITLEVTLINKRLVTEEIKFSTYTYPIRGLDVRCNPKAPDISIGFGFMEVVRSKQAHGTHLRRIK
jgi:hypothetical protein